MSAGCRSVHLVAFECGCSLLPFAPDQTEENVMVRFYIASGASIVQVSAEQMTSMNRMRISRAGYLVK